MQRQRAAGQNAKKSLLWTYWSGQSPEHQHHQITQECEEAGSLARCWWEGRVAETLWKTVWQFLTNTSLFLDHIAVMPVGICIKKLKTQVQLKAKTQMLIAALSTTPKLWEQIPNNQDLLQWRIDKEHIQSTEYIQCEKETSFSPWRRLMWLITESKKPVLQDCVVRYFNETVV